MKRLSLALVAVAAALSFSNTPLFAQTSLSAQTSGTPAAVPSQVPPAAGATAAPETAKKPDDATMKAAADFVDVTQSTSIVDRLLPVVLKNFTSVIAQSNPDKKDIIPKLVEDTFTPVFHSRLDIYKSQLTLIYATHLTQAQLVELTAFYKTPSGQAYLNAMPGIMAETITSAKTWMGQSIKEGASKLVPVLSQNKLSVPVSLHRQAVLGQ